MLNEVAKTNGHDTPAPDDRLARIERRIAALAESNEQRVAVLRGAVGDYTAAEWAKHDEEVYSLIANMQKRIADLESQLAQHAAVDRQVAEVAARLEERQARRDRDKNGITGGDFIQTMSIVVAQERQSAREEFKVGRGVSARGRDDTDDEACGVGAARSAHRSADHRT